jgi:hypothetical protein
MWKGDGWLSHLDWAVYHADGWETWQAFRLDLTRVPMIPVRIRRMEAWYDRDPTYANVLRVLNLTRSMRGLWSRHPCIVDLNARMNNELRRMQEEVTRGTA